MNQYAEKAFEYIDAIAAKLGVAATQILEVMAKQMVVEGIIYGIITLLLLTLSGYIVSVLIRSVAYRKYKTEVVKNSWGEEVSVKVPDSLPTKIYESLGEDGRIGLSILAFAVVGIITLASIFTLSESVMKIINPEYYVIREILNLLGGN